MNTKFAVAIHILSVLAFTPSKHVSSDWIAKSVNTNPVLIRKILALLRNENLVNISCGSEGGAILARPASTISLLDVLKCLKTEDQAIFKRHHNLNLNCQIGSFIGFAIDEALETCTNECYKSLDNISIEDLMRKKSQFNNN